MKEKSLFNNKFVNRNILEMNDYHETLVRKNESEEIINY